MKNDKTKILVLRIIIALLIISIGIFLVLAVFDLSSTEEAPKLLGTTTRRTYSTTSTSSTSLVVETPDITTNKNEGSTNPTNKTNSTSGTKSTKKTTNKVDVTTKTTTESSGEEPTSPIPVVPDYTEAQGASKHPQAVDEWEWEIISKINETRVKNGLSKLIVAEDLRTKAETAADKYYLENDDAVKRYLDGYNNYRLKSNNPGEISVNSLYQNTISSISIETNKYIKYVGVGVIYRETGWAGLPSYYYCIIYE